MHTANFAPLNDIRNHLVYCENGSSIETVMVNGEVVVQDGRLTKVDEKALLAELRALMPEFQAYTRGVEAANHPFESAFADIIRRCYGTDLGFTRWASDAG